MSGQRRRRTVEDARREILDAAESLLADGGPDAVRVQTVARAVGVSDAAVHYHFGSRAGLLDALLRDVGRRLKADLTDVGEVGDIVDLLDDVYRRRGYARLTAWMRLSGWHARGSGMLRPLAEAVHASREPGAAIDDTLHLVVLANLVVWADAVVGDEWRRSVGLPATPQAAAEFRSWFADLLDASLGTGERQRRGH